MENTAPYEIIQAPFTIYTAAVGTGMPDIHEAPGGSWSKLGTSGDRNYTRDGVKLASSQSIGKFRPYGSTLIRKMFRTEEGLVVSATVADMSLAQLAKAFNGNVVDESPDEAGDAGAKALSLYRGFTVQERAVLVRGEHASPYGNYAAQFQIYRAVMIGEPELVSQQGDDPIAYLLQWELLENLTAEGEDDLFAKLVCQDAPAS